MQNGPVYQWFLVEIHWTVPQSQLTRWKLPRKPKSSENHKQDKDNYLELFDGTTIPPFSEVSKALGKRILSFVFTNVKPERLIGLKRKAMAEVLRTNCILVRNFCLKNFATWNILLPTEDEAVRLYPKDAIIQIVTARVSEVKNSICFHLHPPPSSYWIAYLVTLRGWTISAVKTGLKIETVPLSCLHRERFQEIINNLTFRSQQIAVEGRRPHYRVCGQQWQMVCLFPRKTQTKRSSALAPNKTPTAATDQPPVANTRTATDKATAIHNSSITGTGWSDVMCCKVTSASATPDKQTPQTTTILNSKFAHSASFRRSSEIGCWSRFILSGTRGNQISLTFCFVKTMFLFFDFLYGIIFYIFFSWTLNTLSSLCMTNYNIQWFQLGST